MKNLILLVLFFGFTLQSSFSQVNPPRRFSLSISAGPAIPVGVFGGKNMENAAVYFPDSSVPNLASISKASNGFAKVGYSIHGTLNYHFASNFYVFLRSGVTNNPISVVEMEDFVNDLYGLDFRFSHENNNMLSITPGLGYFLKKGSWEYRTGIFLGYGQINYPYYEMVRVVGNETLTWAHAGSRPSLSSITVGGNLQVSRAIGKFQLGLEVSYQRADFDYSIFPRTSPGGSQSVTYEDTIKVRTLNFGLFLLYPLIGHDK
ncbi:MAG: hypothetical protein HLUCCX10_01380 [Algoriphagus marincola HL-49]|uniref:Outer membrane protein beta-barrel domain-containing protein n=1 Tax=Algoriphagus marincola HL-49 TaxID=1305737 RepID=A0A0P8CAD9_9BACT|nr:MAG: hypothetical protein HLUCCX10_01380 [Algoriphagus marincola HL-49]